MPAYLDLDLTVDQRTLADDASAWREAQEDGWTPAAGNPEVWLIEAVARIASTIAVLVGRVPLAIFTYFGQSVLKVPTIDATYATGQTTWTMIDTAGYTVPAGTDLAIADQAFQTTTDTIVPPGSSTASITVTAVVAGSDGSGLTGPVALADSLAFVLEPVVLVGQTTGGTDGETPDAYADRLADELPTFSAKAIAGDDLAVIARTDPEVERALGLNLYVPSPPTSNVPGAATVVLQNSAGLPVSSAAKTRVTSLLTIDDNRILNQTLYVIDPSYTTIDVAFSVHVYPGQDPAVVRLAVIAALQAFLDPSMWGQPALGQQRVWLDEPEVRLNDLIGVADRVEGVRRVDTLTLAVHGGTLATSDVTMTGPGALPLAGTIDGTASL